jgi:hypothetical protein
LCELLVLDVFLGRGLLILIVGSNGFNNNKFCIDQDGVRSGCIIEGNGDDMVEVTIKSDC